ncbi:MAG: helix-turn-helix domain-containing protein [Bryobacteraceae bacterium]
MKGYDWIDRPLYVDGGTKLAPSGENPAARCLVPRSLEWHPGSLADEQGIFLSLADVASDEAAVPAYANKFGMLGSRLYTTYMPYGKVYAETPLQWRQVAEDIRHVVALWEAVRSGQIGEFVPSFKKAPDGGPIVYSPQGNISLRPVVFDQTGHLEPERLSEINYLKLAELALKQLINDQLADLPLKRQFSPDAWEFIDGVDTMLAAVWHYLALAVKTNAHFNKCERCSKWFPVSADKQDDMKFCSPACRNKAYRRRVELAKELHAKGLSVAAIAERLQVKADSVERWIK